MLCGQMTALERNRAARAGARDRLLALHRSLVPTLGCERGPAAFPVLGPTELLDLDWVGPLVPAAPQG
jgi:hypothetical protein